MNFEVDINGRTRKVSVERRPDGKYRVLLDGGAHELDVVRSGIHGLSLIMDEERISRELQVTPSGVRGELLVTLGGRVIGASINARQTGRAGADAGAAADGEQPVVAPMPGRVMRVLVAVGDQVAVRQGVVVVEAMKMENELRSPKAGRVKDIHVAAGTSVEAGRVLLVVE